MKIKYLTMLSCMSLFFCVSIVIVGAVDINQCGTLGIAGATYIMTTNVSTNDSTCFKITAANVTIDCNGFSIIVNNALNIGSIYSYQPNTVEKNCNIPISTPDGNIEDSKKISNSIDNSKKALFDIVSEIVSEPKTAGEDLIVKVSLINFGASNTIDANLEYIISDSNKAIVRQYTKTVSVTTQTEFLEHINTEGMITGKYILKIELIYAGQTFPASTEKVFYVGAIKKLFRNANVKTFILPVITLALLIGVYRKSRINKLKKDADAIKEDAKNSSNFEKTNL